MDSETARRLDEILAMVDEGARLLARLGDQVEAEARERQELAADVAELGRRVTLLDLAITGEAARRETADNEISDRITHVHNKALRELTRRAEGSTTA